MPGTFLAPSQPSVVTDRIPVISCFRGMRIEFLPPYSPDLNPIEEAFSSIKSLIRRNRDFIRAELLGDDPISPYTILYDVVHSVTAEKAYTWFHHSGYL